MARSGAEFVVVGRSLGVSAAKDGERLFAKIEVPLPQDAPRDAKPACVSVLISEADAAKIAFGKSYKISGVMDVWNAPGKLKDGTPAFFERYAFQAKTIEVAA